VAEGIGLTKEVTTLLTPSKYGTVRAWFDASQESFANDDAVANFSDWSGNNYDLLQATGANKPLFKLNAANGRPALLFDGVNDRMATASFGSSPQPITIYLVAKSTGSTAAHRVLADGIGASNRHLIYSAISTGLPTFGAGSAVQGFEDFGDDWFLITAVFNGADSKFIVNDILSATGNIGTQTLTGITLGSAHDGSSPWAGYIAQAIYFDGTLTTDSDYTVRRALQAQYKIPYFDPSSISGLHSKYMADTLRLRDGELVDEWEDTVSAKNVLQATAADQPALIRDELNHHPVLRFDVTNYLTSDSFTTINQPRTFFIVAKNSSTAAHHVLFDGVSAPPQNQMYFENSTGKLVISAGTELKTTYGVGTDWAVWVAVYNGSSSAIYQNGEQIASGTANTQGLDRFRIGALHNATFPFLGDYYALLHWDGDLSASNSLLIIVGWLRVLTALYDPIPLPTLPAIFFADYDLNQPNYGSYSGDSIRVVDSGAGIHEIGFDANGKLDRAQADAIEPDLKVTIIYDKSGNGRNATATGGDWLLKWDVRGVPYLEAQHVDARFKTASTYSWAAPKVFSVASTNDDETNTYLWDLGGNFFAYNATTEAVYDLPTYPPNLGFAYNGTQLFSPVFTPDSFPLYTNETAPGLHHRYVKFQAGNDELWADGALLVTAGNAGDTGRTGAICIGNFDTGGFGGLQRYYDLKVVEGAITDANRDTIIAYQQENSQCNQEHVCVVLGDSLAYGYDGGSIYSAPLLGSLSDHLQDALGMEWNVWNMGRTGDTTGEVISSGILDYAIEKYRPGKLNKVILNGCFNDFNDDVAVATTKANLITTISTLQAAGFEVYLRTPPRSAFTSENWKGYDAYRAGLITWMLAGTSGANGIVDETGDPNIGTSGDPTNTTYFFSDKIHGKSPYYQIVADLALPFIVP